MRKISQLKRHFMALALGISFLGINTDQAIAGAFSSPSPSQQPSKSPSEVNSPADKALDSQAPSPVSQASKISEAPVKFDITKGFSSIAEKAIMAVVNVSTTQIIEGPRPGREGLPQFLPGSPFEDLFKEFFNPSDVPRKVQTQGSGFIIKSDKDSTIIVTNYHVVSEAKKVSVFLNDNTEMEATILAFDERTDIALLKVKTDNLPAEKRILPTLEWGDSETVKVGDWILAIGNPFGLGSTLTSGIISNRARDISMRGGGRGRVNDLLQDLMQHSAAINMGNSGGPLLNLEGKVVGINTAIYSPSGGNIGIGFAIPSALAQDTVNQLLKLGRTKRGWVGARVQVVTKDIAESLGLEKARGAIVGSVTPEGPAAKAKIEPIDIILEFDGKEINENTHLSSVVGKTPVGKTVKVKIWRKGKEMTLEVVVGEFETAPERATDPVAEKKKAVIGQDSVEVLGMKVSGLTPELKERFKLSNDSKGIMIINVDENSSAAEIGLRGVKREWDGKEKPGDIIEGVSINEKVNQKELTKPEEFIKIVEEAKQEKHKYILLLVTREREPRFVPLRLENEDLKEDTKDAKDKPAKDSDNKKEADTK